MVKAKNVKKNWKKYIGRYLCYIKDVKKKEKKIITKKAEKILEKFVN